MKICVVAIVLAVWAVSATPAQPAPDGYVVSVAVSEGRGVAVPGLTPADFLVRLGETEQKVTGVEPDPRPVAIVVMVDGVIAEEALQMRATLTAILKRIRETPGARVGLMLGERGASAPEIVDAVAGADGLNRRVLRFFRAEVTAPPQDLLAGAVASLRREETHRRVAVVLSVNRRTDRVTIPETLVPSLRNANVTLASIEAGSTRGASVDPALRMIQGVVGGRFEQVPDVTAFESAAVRLVSSLMSSYLVTFALTEPANGALQVAVKDRPRATVIAPAWASAVK